MHIDLRDRIVEIGGRRVQLREYQPHVVQSWVKIAFGSGILVGMIPFVALLTQIENVCQ